MARKPTTPKPTAPSVSWPAATVRPDEMYSPTKIAGRADQLALRAVGWAEICSHVLATHCTSQVLRLYRKDAGLSKSRKYRSVPRAQAKFMRGEKGDKPGGEVVAASSGSDFVEVLQHPVLDLLRKPNPFLRGAEWRYLRFKYQEVTGNAYSFVYADGQGVEAYILPSQNVTIQASPTEIVSKYRYSRNRTTYLDLTPDQVMHQRHRPSIYSPILGASPMESVIAELDLYAASIQAETNRWMNGGSPPVVFEFPDGTQQTVIDDMQQRIDAQTRGVRKAGKNLFLAGGVKASPLGVPAKEMEYLEGLQEIKSIVWAAWDIPESEMKLNDANLASATAGNPQLMRRGVLPRINSDADSLTECLLPLYGLDPREYWFAYDNPCIDDMVLSSTMVKTLLDARAITVNEARVTYLELPASSEEGADKLPTTPPAPSFGGFGGPPREPTPPAKAWDAKAFRAGTFKKSGWHFSSHSHATKAVDGTDKPLTPEVQRASDALDRDLAAWHEKAARLLADNPTANRAALEAELQTILTVHLADIVRAGAADTAAQVGAEAATIAERGAADFVRSYVIRLRDSITKDFEADINDAIRAAIQSGATRSEAHAEVADIIGEQASYRAERIARTETSRAYNMGAVNAYGEAGWKKENLLAGGACAICEGVALKFPDPVDADTVFYAVGDSFGGVVNEYADCTAPPYHPNCRCGVAPVPPEPGESV